MRRDVRLFFVATFVIGLTLMDGIYPVLFNLYLLRLGYGPEYIGVANAMGMLGYALFSLPAGIVARWMGIRQAMIGSLALATLTNLVLPLGEFLPASLWLSMPAQDFWILAMRLLSTLGMALYYVTSVPFLIGATAPENRNYAYSIRMGMAMVAGFLGSLVGGVLPGLAASLLGVPLNSPTAYRYPLMLGAALCGLGVAALMATGDIQEGEANPSPAIPSDRPSLPRREIFWIIAVMSLSAILRPAGLGVARTFFNVYLDDGLGISTARIGLIYALIQITSLPFTLAMPVMAARLGAFRLINLSALATALSVLPMAIPHWIAVSLGRFGTYAFSGVSDAALSVYQMEIVPPRWRSTIAGATATTFGLAWAAIAYGGGYMIAAVGYPTLFVASGAVSVVGTLVFWAYFRVPRGEFRRDQ